MRKSLLLVTVFSLFMFFFWSCEEKIKTDESNQPVEVAFVLNNPGLSNPGAAMLKGAMRGAGIRYIQLGSH